tara:strand:- start:286 stop:1974 length:1689 start_codon:yes stop_codon:yes gene_type:complete
MGEGVHRRTVEWQSNERLSVVQKGLLASLGKKVSGAQIDQLGNEMINGTFINTDVQDEWRTILELPGLMRGLNEAEQDKIKFAISMIQPERRYLEELKIFKQMFKRSPQEDFHHNVVQLLEHIDGTEKQGLFYEEIIRYEILADKRRIMERLGLSYCKYTDNEIRGVVSEYEAINKPVGDRGTPGIHHKDFRFVHNDGVVKKGLGLTNKCFWISIVQGILAYFNSSRSQDEMASELLDLVGEYANKLFDMVPPKFKKFNTEDAYYKRFKQGPQDEFDFGNYDSVAIRGDEVEGDFDFTPYQKSVILRKAADKTTELRAMGLMDEMQVVEKVDFATNSCVGPVIDSIAQLLSLQIIIGYHQKGENRKDADFDERMYKPYQPFNPSGKYPVFIVNKPTHFEIVESVLIDKMHDTLPRQPPRDPAGTPRFLVDFIGGKDDPNGLLRKYAINVETGDGTRRGTTKTAAIQAAVSTRDDVVAEKRYFIKSGEKWDAVEKRELLGILQTSLYAAENAVQLYEILSNIEELEPEDDELLRGVQDVQDKKQDIWNDGHSAIVANISKKIR